MGRWWRLGLAGVLGACLLVLLSGRLPVRAQDDGRARWQVGAVTVSYANRLYTPSSGALFARHRYGLSRSDDGGRTWRSVSLVDGPGKRISSEIPQVAIAFDPINHAVAYYGGRDGLYLSTDDALHWRQIVPVSGTILNVEVSRADPRLVYFVAEAPGRVLQVWRSRDAGESWDQLPALAPRVPDADCFWQAPILYAHPSDPARVLLQASCVVGDAPGQTPLLMSADQGESWTASYAQPASFSGKLVGGEGADPRRFYLFAETTGRASGYALLRSDDDGHTWTPVDSSTFTTDFRGMTYDPRVPDRVFVGWRASEDGGKTWAPMVTEGLEGTIFDLAPGIDGKNLFAATDKGVYWLPLLANGAPPMRDMPGAAQGEGTAQPSAGAPRGRPAWEFTGQRELSEQLITSPTGAVFVRTGDGTLLRTDDLGTTWTRVDAPTKSFSTAVAIDPTDPATMYVEGAAGIEKTDNNARTWKQILPLRETVHAIAVSPADRNVVYASVGTGPSRFLRSRDGGQSWETLQEARRSPPDDPQGCGWYTWLLVPHPTDAGRVFAATGCFQADHGPDSGLKLSTDQGQSWADAFSDPGSFPIALVGGRDVAPERFYLAAGNHLLRSDDNAATWTELLVNGLSAVAYDPSSPDRVYVGLKSSGVRASTDGGATWTDLGSVGSGLLVKGLALGPDGTTLFAATNQGVWRLPSAP